MYSGKGENIADFSGDFADYKITKMGDGLLVRDRTQRRDDSGFLRKIEKLNFNDIKGYLVPTSASEWENLMPVEDILHRDSRGRLFDRSRLSI